MTRRRMDRPSPWLACERSSTASAPSCAHSRWSGSGLSWAIATAARRDLVALAETGKPPPRHPAPPAHTQTPLLDSVWRPSHPPPSSLPPPSGGGGEPIPAISVFERYAGVSRHHDQRCRPVDVNWPLPFFQWCGDCVTISARRHPLTGSGADTHTHAETAAAVVTASCGYRGI